MADYARDLQRRCYGEALLAEKIKKEKYQEKLRKKQKIKERREKYLKSEAGQDEFQLKILKLNPKGRAKIKRAEKLFTKNEHFYDRLPVYDKDEDMLFLQKYLLKRKRKGLSKIKVEEPKT